MSKKTVVLMALLFAFTLSLTLAITVSASDFPPTCCQYHYTVNGVDCWTGGVIENGMCVRAEPWIYHDGRIYPNRCYTTLIVCAQ